MCFILKMDWTIVDCVPSNWQPNYDDNTMCLSMNLTNDDRCKNEKKNISFGKKARKMFTANEREKFCSFTLYSRRIFHFFFGRQQKMRRHRQTQYARAVQLFRIWILSSYLFSIYMLMLSGHRSMFCSPQTKSSDNFSSWNIRALCTATKKPVNNRRFL